MIVKWSVFKEFVVSRSLSIQFIEIDLCYFMKAADGFFVLECNLNTDEDIDDAADFEMNFKANGNVSVQQKTSVQVMPSFGSKTAVINGVLKKFYARNTGAQYDLVSGANDISFSIGYPWVKVTGVECFGAETFDTCELRVHDSPAGTYSGVSGALLNQFGYALNIGKDFYQRSAPYDADLYYGMVLKMNYVSNSVKRIGINYLMTEVKS